MIATDYHGLVTGLMQELINHGFGELTFKVTKLKGDDTRRVDVLCGRQYVFFLREAHQTHED